MIILTSKYTNNSGSTFWIKIYDREATEPRTTEFDCGPEFFTLKHEGDKNDTFKRIIPATAQWKILTGCYDYTETQVTDIAAFYEDLSSSFEGRFYVTLQHGSDVIFRGKILPDVGDFLMNDIGDFVLTAIDGITDLQDIEYRPTGYSDELAEFAIRTWTFNEHFIDIVMRIDTVSYFREYLAASSVVMRLISTASNWTESYYLSGDLWDTVKVRNYWYEQKSPSYRKYKSCWEALTDLLTGMNAICYYDRGRYYIEQRSVQDNNPEDITYRHYAITPLDEIITVDGDLQKVQHNYNDNDELWAGVGATRGRLPAFKAVELEQGKQFTNYINGMQLSVYSGAFTGISGPFDFGYVIGSGNKLVLQWNGNIELGTAWAAAPYLSSIAVEWILRFKLQIGDYYLKADDVKYTDEIINLVPQGAFHVGPCNVEPEVSWSLIDRILTLKWERTFISTSLSDFNDQVSLYRQYVRNSALVIESKEIQEDGNFTFEMIDFVTKRNGTTIGGFPPGFYSIAGTSRIIIASGYNDLYEQPEGIKRYEIGDFRNSIVFKTKLGYYDSPDSDRVNRLFSVIDETTDFPTVEWTDPDAAITLPIEELMMKSILSMRQRPAKIYNIDLYYKSNDIIHFGDQVAMYGAVTIPIDMELIASGPGGYTTFRTTLWEIEKDYDGINIVDTGVTDGGTNPNEYPIPDGSLDAFSPGGIRGGVEYWEEWENVSTSYVEAGTVLEVMVNLLPDYIEQIKQQWQLYINGVKQRYTPDGTMKVRDWRFDLDNNRIIIVKGAGNVAHIEIYKYY